MEPRNWTEVQQMKWNLRSMVGDAAHTVVRHSSLFTAMDICYHAGGRNIGFYGLLAATCAAKPGSTVPDDKRVDHVRPAYRAAQSIFSLFDDDVVPVTDVTIGFQCTRVPTNGAGVCKVMGDNATAPKAGVHCDLAHTTSVAHYPDSNEMMSADACRQRCCGTATSTSFGPLVVVVVVVVVVGVVVVVVVAATSTSIWTISHAFLISTPP